MEDEWEEQEQLVVVELSGIINSDFLTKGDGKCKIVGIDTEQPMMQVGRYVFTGEYEDVLGTCVIFEESPGCDSESASSPELKYKCHTLKKLMMQRTFLSEKKDGEHSSEGIEVLQLNDGEFSNRSNTICNFLHDPNKPVDEDVADRGSPGSPIQSSGSAAEASDSEQIELGQSASGYQQTGDDVEVPDDTVTHTPTV